MGYRSNGRAGERALEWTGSVSLCLCVDYSQVYPFFPLCRTESQKSIKSISTMSFGISSILTEVLARSSGVEKTSPLQVRAVAEVPSTTHTYQEPLEAVRPKDRHQRYAEIGLFFTQDRFPHL